MSKARDVQIQGDGNAIGDNNRILVDKRTFMKITHQSNGGNGGGDGGRKRGNGDDGLHSIGLPLAFLVAVALVTWKFAFYANAIYMILMVVTIIIAMLQAVALMVGAVNRAGKIWIVERVVAIVAAVFLGIAIFLSRSAYPSEMSALQYKLLTGIVLYAD